MYIHMKKPRGLTLVASAYVVTEGILNSAETVGSLACTWKKYSQMFTSSSSELVTISEGMEEACI
jgi:hypothetical protein